MCIYVYSSSEKMIYGEDNLIMVDSIMAYIIEMILVMFL